MDNRKWGKKNIDDIKKRIIEDLEFDGYEAHIHVESVAGSNLEIHLEITDDSPVAYIRIVRSLEFWGHNTKLFIPKTTTSSGGPE